MCVKRYTPKPSRSTHIALARPLPRYPLTRAAPPARSRHSDHLHLATMGKGKGATRTLARRAALEAWARAGYIASLTSTRVVR